jgi:hypothetical protein
VSRFTKDNKYELPWLKPQAAKGGFETLVRGPVTVTLGIQTLNAQLKAGAVSQQDVVTTDDYAANRALPKESHFDPPSV